MIGELYPICFECRNAMRLVALEHVFSPAKQARCMSVYVCSDCGRLASYEVAKLDRAELRDTMPAGRVGS